MVRRRAVREFKETFSVTPGSSSRRMTRWRRRARWAVYLTLFLIGVFYLAGCASTGSSHESYGIQMKLTRAREALSLGRARPAERLIRQAMKEAETAHNNDAIAATYHDYGLFLNSSAVEQHAATYRAQGFLDGRVSYDTRQEKALEYLAKAEALESQLGRFDALTHSQFTMANIYYYMGDKEHSCQYYDKSLRSFERNAESSPTSLVKIPEGFASYPDYISDLKKTMICP
jgi:tetratricopeptide (TPR) repeat protein